MRIPNLQSTSSRLLLMAALSAFLALPACSVNVDKGESGNDKKVDIETPVGGLHVSNDADVRDVGVAVYPGARPKPKDDNAGEEKNANVNISAGSFGLKVVALEYLSDDSPDKVLAYYTNELKKYGKVLQCTGTNTSADIHMGKSDDDSDSDEMTCGDSKGSGTELKAGSKHNQHIVSVKPNGKGSDFALVYIRTRGKDTI